MYHGTITPKFRVQYRMDSRLKTHLFLSPTSISHALFSFLSLYTQTSQLVTIAAMVFPVGSTIYTAHQARDITQQDLQPPHHSSSLLEQQPESGFMCSIDILKGGKFVVSTLASFRETWAGSTFT
jgi:hypothetical protein